MTLPRAASGGAHPLLPVSALVGGALALVAGAAWLLAEPQAISGFVGSPGSVALTHLFTLLFVTLIYLGTLQQLPAVLLVTDLEWRASGWVTVPLFVSGAVLLVWGFASGFRPIALAAGGGAVVVALGIAAAQVLATARKSPPKDPASRGLVTAVCYMFLAVTLGLLLAGARSSPLVATAVGYPATLHQTTGIIGAFMLGIVASGHKLLSMFALSKGGPLWRVRAAIALTHGVVALSALAAVAPLAGWPPTLSRIASDAAILLVSFVAAMQFIEVGALLRRRLRRRLEAPVERYVLAHAFLPLAGVMFAVGSQTAAAVALLLGFVGLAVSGMLVKILSFLTWTSAFGAARDAAAPPPLLKDLSRAWLEPVITAGLTLGALAATLAILTGSLLAARLAASALLVGSSAQLLQVLTVVMRTLGRQWRPASTAVTTK